MRTITTDDGRVARWCGQDEDALAEMVAELFGEHVVTVEEETSP